MEQSLPQKFTNYFGLIRTHDFLTFAQTIMGFLAIDRTIDANSLLLVFKYILILGPGLYGGIYIFNNIMDYRLDKHSSSKQKRPLVSGQISIKTAWTLFAVHLLISVISIILVSSSLLSFFALFFLVSNVFYTLIAKKIPYLEIISCSITHPARTLLGIILAQGNISRCLLLLVINLFAAAALNTLKRIKEKELCEEKGRPVLERYSTKSLILIMWLFLSIASLLLALMVKDITLYLFAIVLVLHAIIPVFIYFHGDKPLKLELLRLWQ